jgi:hypothetical protein
MADFKERSILKYEYYTNVQSRVWYIGIHLLLDATDNIIPGIELPKSEILK